MLKQPQLTDDLFEKSSMSFGEHLDELRRALIKAALWLAAGTMIGLFFAEGVVKFIKQPLSNQIDAFHVKQAKKKFKSVNNTEAPERMLQWMLTHSMMPEAVFVDASHLVVPGNTPEAENTKAPNDSAAKKSTAGAGKTTEQPDEGSDVVWKQMDEQSIDRLQPLLIMRPIPNRLSTFDALEGFLIWLKAGLLVGATIASPGIFWHLWNFLAAGLYPHERRYVYLYLPLSVILFVSGVCLAFFVLLELVIDFLLTYNAGMDIDFAPRLNSYVSFALMLPLGFGIAFQLPIVMLALNRFGIVSTEMYISKWRMAVLAIAFLSMILTPADAYSMIGMFIPLTLLYFLGIALCRYMPKGPGLGSQAFDPS